MGFACANTSNSMDFMTPILFLIRFILPWIVFFFFSNSIHYVTDLAVGVFLLGHPGIDPEFAWTNIFNTRCEFHDINVISEQHTLCIWFLETLHAAIDFITQNIVWLHKILNFRSRFHERHVYTYLIAFLIEILSNYHEIQLFLNILWHFGLVVCSLPPHCKC